jgi:hypothetical protein
MYIYITQQMAYLVAASQSLHYISMHPYFDWFSSHFVGASAELKMESYPHPGLFALFG